MLQGAAASSAQTSAKTNVESMDSASIHIKFSAPNTGIFTVEARNGVYNAHEDSVNWYALDFGAVLQITAESEVQILLKEMPFSEIRLVWTPSAGAGTMNAYLTMKNYGA